MVFERGSITAQILRFGLSAKRFGTIERGFNGGWVVGKVVINFYLFAVVIDCADQLHTAFDASKIG